MKKYLMTVMAAVTLGGLFTGCTKEMETSTVKLPLSLTSFRLMRMLSLPVLASLMRIRHGDSEALQELVRATPVESMLHILQPIRIRMLMGM